MGNSGVKGEGLTEERVEEYSELTYLSKSEIHQIYCLLNNLMGTALSENIDYRFSSDQIEKILPQIHYNPFRDSIYRVFSSKQDHRLSFEDTLDFCSALSDNCPANVRAAWAFQMFDFDEDNRVSLNDLMEAIRRLTASDEGEQSAIDQRCAEHVARMILKEMDLSGAGSIGPEEFMHFVARMPEFLHIFRLKI